MTRLILCTLLMVILMILISCTGTGEGASSTVKISSNGKEVSEEIKVDVKKNLEMYTVREPASAKNATLFVMYDFNKGLRMIKVPGSECYLRKSTRGVIRPAALQKYLKQGKRNSKIKVSGKTIKEVWKNVVKLTRHERSNLGKEMAGLCEKLQIFQLSTGKPNNSERVNDPVLQSEEIQMQDSTSKGQLKRTCHVIENETCWDEPEERCAWWKCRIVAWHRRCRSNSKTVCN